MAPLRHCHGRMQLLRREASWGSGVHSLPTPGQDEVTCKVSVQCCSSSALSTARSAQGLSVAVRVRQGPSHKALSVARDPPPFLSAVIHDMDAPP